MTKCVYVVGGDPAVVKMFKDAGWVTFTHPGTTGGTQVFDLICFTGGEDVSPHLYGEENIASYCNEARDSFEQEIYEEFVGKVPMVGICRGGQFLNVCNGGKLIQHLGETISGDVDVGISWSIEEFEILKLRVDHHQGIIPNPDKIWHGNMSPIDKQKRGWPMGFQYSVFYPDTKCWCFQPHPEWGHEPTRQLFFELIEEYILCN